MYLHVKEPFHGSTLNETVEKILTGTYTLPSSLSTSAQSLIKQLLNVDPNERLSFARTIQEHSFFTGIDWNKLQNKQLVPPFKPLPVYFLFTFSFS